MKQIPLTQGQVALVDDADHEWLSQWKWCANKDANGNFYAVRSSPAISMAREILGLKQGDPREADHKNHNTLNNRRFNLRICTRQQNHFNQKPSSNKTSRFKGVTWNKHAKKWQAAIKVNGRSKHLGIYNIEEKAALAYNQAAKEYFGMFAYLNSLNKKCE